MKQYVTHYAGCSNVNVVHVVWSEIEPPATYLQAYFKRSAHLNLKQEQT